MVFVNGDVRIGIFTSMCLNYRSYCFVDGLVYDSVEPIKKFGELFLDYGDAYWTAEVD